MRKFCTLIIVLLVIFISACNSKKETEGTIQNSNKPADTATFASVSKIEEFDYGGYGVIKVPYDTAKFKATVILSDDVLVALNASTRVYFNIISSESDIGDINKSFDGCAAEYKNFSDRTLTISNNPARRIAYEPTMDAEAYYLITLNKPVKHDAFVQMVALRIMITADTMDELNDPDLAKLIEGIVIKNP